MEAEDRRLLLEIHGTVKGIEPVLIANTQAVGRLDDRTRALEIKHGEHDVKIARINSDLDGLGRKVRTGIAAKPAEKPWGPIIDAVIAVPKWIHAIYLVGLACTLLVRHWPK